MFSKIVDYADTMSAQSTPMQTPCWRSQRLCRHGVGVVNDYADTFGNFEGFSQILKKQSGKKGIQMFLHIQQQ